MEGVDKIDFVITVFLSDLPNAHFDLYFMQYSWIYVIVGQNIKEIPPRAIFETQFMDLLYFRMTIAHYLVKVGKPSISRKHGRLSTGEDVPENSQHEISVKTQM